MICVLLLLVRESVDIILFCRHRVAGRRLVSADASLLLISLMTFFRSIRET